MAASPVTVVRAFIERINAHDIEGLTASLTVDHRFIDSLGAIFVGRETLRQGWQAYFALVADYNVSIHALAEFAAGVLLVGEAGGRSNGVAWTVPAAWRAVVRDGRVAEWQVYADNEPLRASLATRPISVDTAAHYVWGGTCDGWHLVRSPDLSVIQERMPPGTSESRHRHGRARQFFYVLRGELTLECASRHHRLTSGQGLEIEPGVPHEARNDSGAPVDFLVISQPPSHGDREPAPPAPAESGTG